jgi:hypothetical protein
MRRHVVAFPDGSEIPFPEALAQERAALRVRNGALSLAFAHYLERLPPEQPARALLMFDAGLDWGRLRPRLSGREGDEERRTALEEVRIGIDSARAALVRGLAGLTVITDSVTMPALVVEGTRAALSRAARVPGVIFIKGAATMEPTLNAAKNGVTDMHTDVVFNSQGLYGEGQRIGHVELAGAGVYDNHEAFALATPDPVTGYRITYQVEPVDCTFDSDCNYYNARCLPLGHPGHPQQCAADHPSQVLSVASGAVGGVPYGAAKARYFYPNGGFGGHPNVACNFAALENAYSWLALHAVTTVNESYSCVPPEGFLGGADAEGTLEDWYARYYDMAITKAAGNQEFGPEEPACPYTLNSTCVGDAYLSGAAIACYSSYTNLNAYPSMARTDREEPDVVAFSGRGGCPAPGTGPNVDVLSMFGGTSGWTTSSGTSFAAPAVAGITALCKEAAGYAVDERTIRLFMKLAGFFRPVFGYNYATTSNTFTSANDCRAGGGGVLADPLYAMCAGVGEIDQRVTVDTFSDDGSDPGEPWGHGNHTCDFCGHNDPPLGGLSLKPASYGTPHTGDNRRYRSLWRGWLDAGQRIRFVITWDSCPDWTDGVGGAPVARDYDLFLLNDGVPVYSSQSVSDVTEGFDVTIPQGMDGYYDVKIAFPNGSLGCHGDGKEPFSAGVMVQW